MTLLKKFNEAGQEIGSDDVPIDETNFQKYIEQYGQERAEGYKDALTDMMKQIRNLVLFDDQYGEDWLYSDQVAGRKVKKYYDHRLKSFETMVAILSASKLQP